MKDLELSQIIEHWNHISQFINYPKNDKQLDKLIEKLDELLDIVGEDEEHELMGLVDIISHFIEKYENEHYSEEQNSATGIDVLKFLMEAHNLSQCDLPEIGSQGVVSEILSGKRTLNLRQINALAKRFNVDISVFVSPETESSPSQPPYNHNPKKTAAR